MRHTDQRNGKADPVDHVEASDNGELPKAIDKALADGDPVQMRSELDNLPILKALRIYWRIALICMMAAFSAALEGYRTLLLPSDYKLSLTLNSRTCACERHCLE